MKSLFSILSLAMLMGIGGFCAPAWADVDDEQRIAACLDDNEDENQTDATLMTYCTCANQSMSGYETMTITQWEKQHADEQEACSKQAGWKSVPE